MGGAQWFLVCMNGFWDGGDRTGKDWLVVDVVEFEG